MNFGRCFRPRKPCVEQVVQGPRQNKLESCGALAGYPGASLRLSRERQIGQRSLNRLNGLLASATCVDQVVKGRETNHRCGLAKVSRADIGAVPSHGGLLPRRGTTMRKSRAVRGFLAGVSSSGLKKGAPFRRFCPITVPGLPSPSYAWQPRSNHKISMA